MFCRFVLKIATVIAGLALGACGGGSGTKIPTGPSTPIGSTSTIPTPTTVPATCFSFSPARATASSRGQAVTVQVMASGSSCSWTATSSTSWITIRRIGPLYQIGSGPLTFEVDQNQDARFGGCTTQARTGRISVSEENRRVEAVLEVVQQGATGPYQPTASCSATVIPYGTTINGSLTTSDCTVNSARAKYYTFQGLEDQEITIALRAGRLVSGGLRAPLFRLYGPGGGFVVGGGSIVREDPTVNRTLFCSGTYTLEVTSEIDSVLNPNGLGNYTLRLTSRN